jgi:hypothetical protein
MDLTKSLILIWKIGLRDFEECLTETKTGRLSSFDDYAAVRSSASALPDARRGDFTRSRANGGKDWTESLALES